MKANQLLLLEQLRTISLNELYSDCYSILDNIMTHHNYGALTFEALEFAIIAEPVCKDFIFMLTYLVEENYIPHITMDHLEYLKLL